MTLLYDLTSTQSQILGPGGGGEYARAVFRRLIEVSGAGLCGSWHPDYPLDDDIAALVADHRVRLHAVRNKGEFQALVSSGQFQAFMSGLPYDFHGVDFSNLHVVLAVHGVRPLEVRMPFHGRHYARGLRAWLKWAARYGLGVVRSDWRRGQFESLLNGPAAGRTIIVPSWHTKYSLREKLNLAPDIEFRTYYCPETAVSSNTVPNLNILRELGLTPGRYLFMVSGHRWVKNAFPGLQAYGEVMKALPPERRIPMVVTGGVPGGLSSAATEHIISPGNVNLESLAGLYKGARAFFYPTLNEGFGYPPLEALAQGTPVLAAAVSSITEVLGDGAIYFSPHSFDEMKIRLRLAVEDDALLAAAAQRGAARLQIVRARQQADLESLCELLAAWTRS